MPLLYPSPITVKLNTDKGYTYNPVTGDSIDPVKNSFGDTLITGVPVPVQGKRIDPSIPAKAKVLHVEKSKTAKIIQMPTEGMINPLVVVVDKDSLKTFTPGQFTSDTVLVNSSGDTVQTGIPFPVPGRVGKFSHPMALRALLTPDEIYFEPERSPESLLETVAEIWE
jgi:hypothetical protein